MLLQSDITYKSLEPFEPPVELPDFVVFSGLNGTGKSQLLVAISQNIIRLLENGQHLIPTKFVDHNTLAPNNGTIVSYDTLRQAEQDLATRYINYRDLRSQNPAQGYRLENVIGDPGARLIRTIAERAAKDVERMSADDIFRHYPVEDRLAPADIFYHNFANLFKRYQIKKERNDVSQFRNQKYGNVESLSDEEFLRIYGEPPWVFVNQIMAEANLDYQINSPDNQIPEAPFELKLVNTLNGAEIDFSDLSSGEKVIMSLALSLYNSNFDVEFPRVLLMDEPEAHLHPSMTKQFLDVIQNVFVAEKGVKVVMTTHSPSTVALAPEESLFLMNKAAPRIEKATKDKALKILTTGVPTLSISYENRRQVFVESRNDVTFYEKIYEKLKDRLVSEISINFISSGVGGRGNCDQVRDIVNTLAHYGNRSIYGIIDWDLRNNGNDFVKILGRNKRYSIENYIFDPLLVAGFLLRERFVDRVTLGLDARDRYTDFSAFDDEKLQAIANVIVNQVRANVGNQPDEIQVAEYVGGHRVNLPSWFLRIQGHELEDILKALFPQLNRYRTEGELKREIVYKVIDDIPDLISSDILLVFREIQNVM